MARLVDQDVGLCRQFGKIGATLAVKKTHPLKVPVNHSLTMDVDQAPSNTSQLDKLSKCR